MTGYYEKLQVLEPLWGEKLIEPSNPDHGELLAHRDAIEEVAGEIGRIVEEEILGRGIRFPQGGLEHGLLLTTDLDQPSANSTDTPPGRIADFRVSGSG
jgi:hypothetical protein